MDRHVLVYVEKIKNNFPLSVLDTGIGCSCVTIQNNTRLSSSSMNGKGLVSVPVWLVLTNTPDNDTRLVRFTKWRDGKLKTWTSFWEGF